MPYIYSAAWGVTSRGETIMQALPFVYPNDLALRDVDDEFLFGNSLLISPVTQPSAASRSVALPAGNDWVDFWSGKTYRGGQTIVTDAPLDQIPILVKMGSIVPMGPVVQSTADVEDPLEIRIYGGKDADLLLYEDGGDSYSYEHGARATILLHWDHRRNSLSIGDRAGTFPGMPSKQILNIVLVKEAHGIGIEPESRVDRHGNLRRTSDDDRSQQAVNTMPRNEGVCCYIRGRVNFNSIARWLTDVSEGGVSRLRQELTLVLCRPRSESAKLEPASGFAVKCNIDLAGPRRMSSADFGIRAHL